MPNGETQRLQALYSLRILDTQPEERFDRITRLARRLFDVPIALVSLVDRDRQWFKSCQGIDTCETPREISFCGHVINQSSVFVVPDALRDERFHDNPLVTENPQIRFYAGCPVHAPGGEKLGTLCVMDTAPRDMSREDQALLNDLGEMVEEEFAALSMTTTDDLTRLSNRAGFRRVAAHVIPLAQRLALPITLVNIDLDNFKVINDTRGHDAGDRALISFAKQLLKTFRASDVVARIGGDEFYVLLTGTARDRIERSLRRLTEALKRSGEPVGFSAGVAVFDPQRHGGVEGFLKEADRQMFERKRGKKDKRARRA